MGRGKSLVICQLPMLDLGMPIEAGHWDVMPLVARPWDVMLPEAGPCCSVVDPISLAS